MLFECLQFGDKTFDLKCLIPGKVEGIETWFQCAKGKLEVSGSLVEVAAKLQVCTINTILKYSTS